MMKAKTKNPKERAKKVGRPTSFTQKLADDICRAISESDKGLIRLCEDNKHWPDRSTILRWLESNNEFCDQYTRAKEYQADYLVEQMIEIADDSSLDKKVNDKGSLVTDNEVVQRSALRVKTREWVAIRLAQKKYGDKITQQHTGADGGAIKHEDVSDAKSKLFDKLTQIVTAASNSGSDQTANG